MAVQNDLRRLVSAEFCELRGSGAKSSEFTTIVALVLPHASAVSGGLRTKCVSSGSALRFDSPNNAVAAIIRPARDDDFLPALRRRSLMAGRPVSRSGRRYLD
jgi:hypothetical protein